MTTVVIVGTPKGAFVLRSEDRAQWTVSEPLFKGWKVTAAARRGGRWLLATASYVYGAAIQVSEDLEAWRQVERGPAWPEAGDRELKEIWKIAPAGDDLWAGVMDAGFFRSRDGGDAWEPVEGLNEHPTRAGWFPGQAGLVAHSFLADRSDPRRLYAGISAVGVFRSDDGGATWAPKNRGVPVIIEDARHADIGYCVHAIVQDPEAPETLFRQDHMGIFRTRDAGESWERVGAGLPGPFGFPLALDRSSRALYAVPMESDEYRMPVGGLVVARSRAGGDTWEEKTAGLPERCYTGVLRGALDVDHAGGVYLGTTGGTVYASRDGGDTWRSVADSLPRVLHVSAYEV